MPIKSDCEINFMIYLIVDCVLDNMIASKQLEEEHRERVSEVLLSRHRHQHTQNEKKGLPLIRSLAEIGRKTSDRKIEGKGIFLY